MKLVFTLLIALLFFGCQKKQYASFQKSPAIQFEKKSAGKLDRQISIPENQVAVISNEITNDLISINTTESLQPAMVEEPKTAIDYQKSLKSTRKLKRKMILDSLLNTKPKSVTEKDYVKMGKYAGNLGLAVIGMILLALLISLLSPMASLISAILLLMTPIVGLIAFVNGIKAIKHLKKEEQSKAILGIALGSLTLLGLLVVIIFLIVFATQFNRN
jgi:uncharacterized membrane protein YkgB